MTVTISITSTISIITVIGILKFVSSFGFVLLFVIFRNSLRREVWLPRFLTSGLAGAVEPKTPTLLKQRRHVKS